uniref:uncharacterized protein isoform X2 n=1 Tax=Myxine glutinosa TaxID=7769 RepID=UPI0035900373
MAVYEEIVLSLSFPSQASESTTPTADNIEASKDVDDEVPVAGAVEGNCGRVEELAICEKNEAREEPLMSCITTSRHSGQKVVENPVAGPGESNEPGIESAEPAIESAEPAIESAAHDEEHEAEERPPQDLVNKRVKELRTVEDVSNDGHIEKLVLEGDEAEEEESTTFTKTKTTAQNSVQKEVDGHLPVTDASNDCGVDKLALKQENAAAEERSRAFETSPHDSFKKGLNKLVTATDSLQITKPTPKQEHAADERTGTISKTPPHDPVRKVEEPLDATDEVNNHLVNGSVLNEGHNATCKGKLRIVKRPQRDAFQKEFEETEQKLDQIVKKKQSSVLTVKEDNEIEELNKVLKKLGQRINALTVGAERQRKRRLQLKEKLSILDADDPTIDDFTEDSDAKYRRLSEQKEQTELLRVTKEVALALCSPKDRLRSKYISHCKSMDQLLEKLLIGGFKICRLESFLRLIPRQGCVANGKEFVSTLPVQLVHDHSHDHASHMDTNFSLAVMSYVKEVCSWFGPKLCSFLSVDDKARVPIEFTATSKDAPLLLQVEYKMESQDSAQDTSTCYKLMSSVYACCAISLNNLFQPIVSFDGPTYIAVRSGEHDNMAFTHGRDIEHLLKLDTFKEVMCNEIGEPKPILVCTVDGWSDENPTLSKTLRVASNQFRLHNLDVYLVATQAPGALAHAHVERRLAPLSRVLFGLIITKGLSGTPADSGKTIEDANLEVVNFKKVGDSLAEVWSSTVIDGYSVTSEYVEPAGLQLEKVSPKWAKNHVRESQYLLQVVRCNDRTCCTEWRSNWNKVFPKRFLPAPYPLQQTTCGLRVSEPSDAVDCHMYTSISQRMAFHLKPASESEHDEVPFDFHCPSVQANLEERLCGKCGMYFASRLAVEHHAGVHSHWDPGPSVDAEGDANAADSFVMSRSQDSAKDPVFRKISDIMMSPWRKVGVESIRL